ncbi:hypothetical protein HKD37_17G048497 [Glycine soja]
MVWAKINESMTIQCLKKLIWIMKMNKNMWARSVAHENGFIAVIMRSDTHTGSRGRSLFVLIGCERSGRYKCRKKEFVRRDTRSRKCGCPFKLRGKPVIGGQGWMVKLICGIHNHELAKSLVGHPYVGRLTKDEKRIIVDMTKSMVKPRNILLTLKEHNANSCTTIKQIYNARSAYHSSITGSDTKITYKTNKYRLPLLDFVGVTPTGMTFFAGFTYLEGERVNNVVWTLEQFRGLFLRRDCLPVVIVTDRDLTLMNVVKTVFPECTNLLCSVWDAMNNMITLQHTQIKASFETSTHVVRHVFKKTLYKRLLGMVSRYVLNEIAAEFERVHYAGKNPSSCDCVMRTTHGLPCACELSRFEELDVCGKATLKSKLREIAYPDQNSMCPPPSKVNTKDAPKKPMNNQRSTKCDPSYWEYVDGFIDNIVDVKENGNCGYWSIATLLGMSEYSWSLVCNQLVKELGKWSDDYINLFGGTDRFDELRSSLLVDGFSKVSVDKWMDIKEMGYVIASRSQPPTDSSVHRIICVGHVFGNHFVQVYLKDRCPLPPLALLWFRNSHPQAKQWPTLYISRMQQYRSFMMLKRDYVDLNED